MILQRSLLFVGQNLLNLIPVDFLWWCKKNC